MRVRLVVCFFFVSVFSSFAQNAPDWYQGKRIRDIVFEGLKNVKSGDLEAVIENYRGLPFTDDIFWDLQGRLYALEYFDLISPTAVPAAGGAEVVLRFTVVERPVISRINFVGNSGIRRNELLDVVSLKVNDVVNQLKLRVDEGALRNKYLEKGYPDVRIRSDSQTTGDGSVVVSFYITEGRRVTISGFRFEGNAIFSDRVLRGELSLKRKGLFNDGAFQEAKLIADRAALVQYYRDRGYLDAELIDAVQDIQTDDKGNNTMVITFRLFEGRMYTFTGIEFSGNEIFPTAQLEALVFSQPGKIANARQIESDLQRVADLYYENGYIFNTINRDEERNSETGTVSYTVSIIERGRAYIENIIVRGNKKTRDEVILREIPLEEGDVFSKAKVMDALRNLYNLQYFSMVAPETPPGSVDSLMNLVFTVEEQPTTDIQLGLTFSGSSDPDTVPISGIFKWNDRNFMGYGNMLGAELSVSPDSQYGTLTYTHRWIFGLPLDGGFDFTLRHSVRSSAMDNYAPFFNGDEDRAFPDGFADYDSYLDANKIPPDEYLMDYTQWSMSLGFSTGYRFSTFLGNLSVGGGLRTGLVLNTYDDDLYRPFDPTLRDHNNQWTPANSFSTSVALDQRDIYYDPSRGYYGVQRVGFYGLLPMEREHYVRTDTKLEWFHTLLNIPITEKYSFKMVFGIHSGMSFILPQFFQEKPVIETVNQLSVDGMFVGRGWVNKYRERGNALWENWAEIRMPLVPGILALDGFFDAAVKRDTPYDMFHNLSVEDMLFSLGAGFRFAIPQFPFRFIFAKRFVIKDGRIDWQTGSIWQNGDPGSGIDFVISFAVSTY
ncbi:MAG: outer membrane protein assembly factor BamA [Spirochaetaceae bacterium]|nr:outer membrane protein assembly factor BamA [Spirochaetaceae bacterium]